MSGLKLENICVSYGKREVLRRLHLEVEDGELLCLLGPSGCGKSTLIKAAAGLLETGRGRVLLDGEDVTVQPAQKRRMVVVFQDLRLFPHLNVAENIAFCAKLQGAARPERQALAARMLKQVRLEGFENHRVQTLSGGQQQRVALARALAAQPRVLLLDEPFANLDTSLKHQMHRLLQEIRGENKQTTLMVTHDIGEAVSLAGRVALMLDGEIVFLGSPKALLAENAPAQAAAFVAGWKQAVAQHAGMLAKDSPGG